MFDIASFGATHHDQRPMEPNRTELAILRYLWNSGPATVRELYEATYPDKAVYTSALKTVQRMHEKGLVKRERKGKSHTYSAAIERQRTMRDVVARWIDTAFAGSPVSLAMQALQTKPIDPAELAELKALIERMEAEDRDEPGARI